MSSLAAFTLGLYVGSIGAAVVIAGGGAWYRRVESRARRRVELAAFVRQLQQVPRRPNGETPIADHLQRLGLEQGLWTGRVWITVPRESVGA